MSEAMLEAEERLTEWTLSEVEGLHPAPDLSETILARLRRPDPEAPCVEEGTRPIHAGGSWASALLVAAGLMILAGIAWWLRPPGEQAKNPAQPIRAQRHKDQGPDQDPHKQNKPPVQRRRLPAAVTVKNEGEILLLPKDIRNVKGWGLDDEELKVLTRARGLERLELFGQGRGAGPEAGMTSDDGMKLLARFPKLRELCLDHQPRLTVAGLKHLGALPLLRSLSLWLIDLQKEELEEIAKRLPNLRELHLHPGMKLEDDALEVLARMHLLQSLTLRGRWQITTEGLEGLLPKLKNLEYLHLSAWRETAGTHGWVVGDELLPTLARLKTLKVLKIPNARVTASGLATLADMKQLRELDLSFIRSVNTHVIRKLPQTIQSLRLHGCRNVFNAALQEISVRFTNLRDLDISYCRGVANHGVQAVLAARELRSLKLSGTPVGKALLDDILAETTLEQLDLALPWVTPAMRGKLQAMPQMRELKATLVYTLQKGPTVAPPRRRDR